MKVWVLGWAGRVGQSRGDGREERGVLGIDEEEGKESGNESSRYMIFFTYTIAMSFICRLQAVESVGDAAVVAAGGALAVALRDDIRNRGKV